MFNNFHDYEAHHKAKIDQVRERGRGRKNIKGKKSCSGNSHSLIAET